MQLKSMQVDHVWNNVLVIITYACWAECAAIEFDQPTLDGVSIDPRRTALDIVQGNRNAGRHGGATRRIGYPWRDGYRESFRSRLRDEFLNREIFDPFKELGVLPEC